jgi:hypothetical protein
MRRNNFSNCDILIADAPLRILFDYFFPARDIVCEIRLKTPVIAYAPRRSRLPQSASASE